ncbi:oxidoreductase [Oryzibacter oryziterrae]|uniref:oxidoreductase n=1 Tax=Oryzibacter oryziterrae TaxID=2766474 RepID=UPI001F3B9E05|nr:FAD-dependent oxidoreductase [Oryzibacter oryziterrae]
MKQAHEILFEPMKIGSVEIKNRYVMAPIGPGGLCDPDGSYNYRGVEYYVERAKGGAGLIMTGVTMVENDIEKCALPSMPCPTLNPLNFIKTAKIMTERIHAYDAKIFLQLSAGFGRVSIPSIVGSTAVAPSPIPHRWLKGVTCRALTIEEIKTYVRKFADSAEIAQKAGFDGIEIHAVHEGYLLDQFAISMFNQRTDEYGGSLENRLRFAIEIVEAIKARCGKAFPVSLRYSIKSFIKDWLQGGLPGEDFVEMGRDIPEGIEAAKILEAAGYDAFNGDVGSYDSWYWSHPPMYQSKGLYLPYNKILKDILKVPVITAGRMDNPDLAADAIVSRQTDFVGLARPLLADPQLPNKVRAGKFDRVRPCLSCQEGCMGRLAKYAQVSCAVNPACGREADYQLTPALEKKTVMIVGGGIAGMEAARVATLRGHVVTLYEKSDRLGGVVIPGGVPDFKEDDHALLAWYERELRELKVPLVFNTEVTEQMIVKAAPDVLIVATGSKPKMLKIGDAANVYTAEDVLNGVKPAGDQTIIIGAGLVGCETALWLYDQGKKVTVVELADHILALAGPLCHANHDMLHELMEFKKIEVMTSSYVAAPTDGGFVVKSKEGDMETYVPADSAILAIGYTSERSLFEKVRNKVPEAYAFGDARAVSNIMYAIWDAYEVARAI